MKDQLKSRSLPSWGPRRGDEVRFKRPDPETFMKLLRGQTVYKSCLECGRSIRLTRGGILRTHDSKGERCMASRTLRWDRKS